MARVNLDGKVWKDPRVKRLAKRRKWSVRETVGTLAAVWDVAYDNKSAVMPVIDVDTAAETDEFAKDMTTADLATQQDAQSVRLRGVTDRIEYLLAQAERGRLGGRARTANAKRAPGGRLANGKQPPALPLAPDLPLAPAPDSKMSGKPDLATSIAEAAVAEINRLSGSNYQATSQSVRDLSQALAKAKHTPAEAVDVVRSKTPWLTEPDRREYFRPSTLLARKNFQKYLDEVRAKPATQPCQSAEVPDVDYDQPPLAFGGSA